MNELLAYLIVLVAAAIPWLEVLFVVPAGVLAGLPTGPTIAVAAVGNIVTLVPVVVAGRRLRARYDRRKEQDPESRGRRQGRAGRLFDRYGTPGMALLGPLLTGAHLAAAVAMAAGEERRRALIWFPAGVAVWSVLAGVLAHLGIDLLFDRSSLPDLGLQ